MGKQERPLDQPRTYVMLTVPRLIVAILLNEKSRIN